MNSDAARSVSITPAAHIIERARRVNLNPHVLYEAVIDLASEGLITAAAVNMAAGILLEDLGLPNYFFENLRQASLKQILSSIATSMAVKDGEVLLFGRVANIDFSLEQGNALQKVRIATEETRDSMEAMLGEIISGHRREYYYSPKSRYYTYIARPETVNDFGPEDFKASRFLFHLAGDYHVTPEPTRMRYERFLRDSEDSAAPLIEVFQLPETGETRLMFNSDFEAPQIAVFRNLCRDHGFELTRAYWEPYRGKATVPASICSVYIDGELSTAKEAALRKDLCAFLSLAVNPLVELYVKRELTFEEMLFAVNAADFARMFIFQERENATDREILNSLEGRDHREAFAARIHKSNKSTYSSKIILETIRSNPDLVQHLHRLFAGRFDPSRSQRISEKQMEKEFQVFRKTIATRFIDFELGSDIFGFLLRFVSGMLKTNFYRPVKRSFSFRFDDRILDPLVFESHVYGIFFVNGHYARGTHLRAGDIARGGVRLIRVTRENHAAELDNAVLLNYALGPKAQRLKHKDICESGSKGVVVPHPPYAAGYGREALFDFTEGILDLMLPPESEPDYHGRPEMIFFGPDEGTAPHMDAVAFHARERGYKHWRTITTGKSFGIPHDTYGRLEDGKLFGLFDRGEAGTELQIEGRPQGPTRDMEAIYGEIGGKIAIGGMTTTSVLTAFRTLVDHFGEREEDLNLMMTGGPDGDLGANQIQSYRGNICLVIDGGSILFDPNGLDRKELTKIAFMRHTRPRANSLFFPREKLGPGGFMVPLNAKRITLPDGAFVEDGALFHRTFLGNPENRRFIEAANIRAFIPCGGLKDTIHHGNVKPFLENFRELEFIVEGANVFFEDAARRHIAAHTAIRHVKDTTANKGGVFSSSIAEVLAAFLLEDDYEEILLEHVDIRRRMIRDIMDLVAEYSRLETRMLIQIHEQDPEIPLFALSERTSEQIFALQDEIRDRLAEILEDRELVWGALTRYIPAVLVEKLGREPIEELLGAGELAAYRDAILTKKLASMAFYRFGLDWDAYRQTFRDDPMEALHRAME
ncbi:MAG: NAD-glutamate dehydrogenase domain-containing protein [Desulfococcaceae bacterium]